MGANNGDTYKQEECRINGGDVTGVTCGEDDLFFGIGVAKKCKQCLGGEVLNVPQCDCTCMPTPVGWLVFIGVPLFVCLCCCACIACICMKRKKTALQGHV